MKRIHYIVALLIAAPLLTAPSLTFAGGEIDPLLTHIKIDQLEIREGDNNPWVLEGYGWIGKDIDKLWIEAEVERSDEGTEEAEVQLLYGKAIAPYWDLQIGVRQDFLPDPNRSWLAFGVQGIAPYFFDIDLTAFIGENSRTALRLSAEYELMLTQRWILTTETEVNFHGKNDPETETGSGLSDIEAGLRLHYEVRREFSPYIGVSWHKPFGNTADYHAKEESDTTQWVIGVSAWF